MAEVLSAIEELASHLEKAVDSSRVLTDPETLAKYACDTSHSITGRPDVVVKVATTAEVQNVVKIANDLNVPVTPKSSGIGFYGAAVPEQGGIVVDMNSMKKIRKIDTKSKWAMFEAGVTYGELQEELAKVGFRAVIPFLPHKDKSVLTSTLEREPKLTPKHHLDETIFTMEMVFPTGELFHTGSMAVSPQAPETIPDELPCDLVNFHGPGIDWFRLIPGSMGTYGIVTVMNVKIAEIPKEQKIVFFGFKSLDESVEPTYNVLRKLIGDECLLLNNRYLATILASDSDDIDRLSSVLPAYTLILNLTAGEWFTDDKIAYLEAAIKDLSRTFLLTPMATLPNVPDAEKTLSQYLYKPWDNGTYWKFRAKGASREIFFLTQMQRAPEFLKVAEEVAAENGYCCSNIGLYLQPKQNGRAFQMELSFPYDPDNLDEKEKIDTICTEVSKALVNRGAFFYRIYGEWADMVYSRTGNLHETLKRIKRTFDPKGILNPGKLGF
jgi:FAD/FMN-containing dehydrogenase